MGKFVVEVSVFIADINRFFFLQFHDNDLYLLHHVSGFFFRSIQEITDFYWNCLILIEWYV
jgi:hypothetical protein